MKNIVFATILAALFLVGGTVSGQAICPPVGISTNPENPINPQKPIKKNSFDWRTEFYRFNYKNSQVINIISPFWDSQNGVTDPVYGYESNSRDYHPEDGWELLAKEFGYEDDNITPKTENISMPYLVLYNKYTGLMRAFFAIAVSDRNEDYNAASVKLLFNTGSFQSSLLLPLTSTVVSFEEEKTIANSTAFINYDFKWFYADFQMNYDPCTCQNSATLKMEVRLISSSNIALTGLINGTIQSITPDGVEDDNGKWSFDVGDLSDGLEKAKSTYKSIDDFKNSEFKKLDSLKKNLSAVLTGANTLLQMEKNIESKGESVDALTSMLYSNKFLRTGLKIAPYVGAAFSFLDVFVGGGKKNAPEQSLKLLPMYINAEVNINGTLSREDIFKTFFISLPGSLNSSNDNNRYPYYNEVLGVISMLKPPKIHYKYSGYYRDYKIAEPISFVLNPAAGFLSNPEIKVAYVIEHDYSPLTQQLITNLSLPNLDQNGNNVELFEREGLNSFRTPYFPLEMLNDIGFATQIPVIQGKSEPRVYLKFLINLERLDATNNTQNVLYVSTYKADLVYNPLLSPYNFNVPAILNYENTSITDRYKQFSTNKIIFKNTQVVPIITNPKDKIFLSSKIEIKDSFISPQGSSSSVLYNTIFKADEIVIEGETLIEAKQNNQVVFDYIVPSFPTINQQTLLNFCNSSLYKKPSRIKREVNKDSEVLNNVKTNIENENFYAYPNPCVDDTSISYTLDENTKVECYISNLLGEKVMTIVHNEYQKTGEHNIKVNTQYLPKGVYFYTLETPKNKITKRLIIL
ncbi:MAG: T9SS type A sorting domain-containing protein [Thermonemataceae bacterium]|nr:T9SS type A sorting domain-containing protein [Thermonemataceae bacterium]